MKKIVLVIALAIFVLPFVNAEIDFSNDFYDKYNLGDVVNVQGYISSDSNVDDIFRLYLECGDNSQILSGRMIHVNRNENYYFNQEVNLPMNFDGTCNFNADFNDESVNSDDFSITDELKGDIFVTDNQVRLGESLNLEGDVYRLSNDRVDGFGILTLSKDSEEFLVDSFDIDGGDIVYSFILDSLPSGDYDLEVEVYDYYGNSHAFSFAQKIEIVDELSARVSLNVYEINQGENLKLNGEIDDSENYEVYVEYGDDSETLNFYSNSFEYDVNLDTLQGGSHSIFVQIIDSYGNFYVEVLNFDVIAVPDFMEVNVGGSVLPGESLSIEATVYDKADYVYTDDVSVKILNPKNNELSSFILNSGDIFNYDVEDYTSPGTYTVEFKSSDFELERNFEISRLEMIDAYYEDNRLKIRNIGNVDLKDDFKVYISEEAIDLDYNLKPSEIEDYDLRGWVEQGIYTTLVSSSYGEIEIDVEVIDDRTGFQKVTGFVVGGNGGSSTLLGVILIIVVAVVVYLFFFRKKKLIPGKKEVYQGDYNKDYEAARSRRKKLLNKREKMKKQPKRLFPSKEIPKEDADQFREDMVKKMKGK